MTFITLCRLYFKGFGDQASKETLLLMISRWRKGSVETHLPVSSTAHPPPPSSLLSLLSEFQVFRLPHWTGFRFMREDLILNSWQHSANISLEGGGSWLPWQQGCNAMNDSYAGWVGYCNCAAGTNRRLKKKKNWKQDTENGQQLTGHYWLAEKHHSLDLIPVIYSGGIISGSRSDLDISLTYHKWIKVLRFHFSCQCWKITVRLVAIRDSDLGRQDALFLLPRVYYYKGYFSFGCIAIQSDSINLFWR